jgi:hypothetical protein
VSEKPIKEDPAITIEVVERVVTEEFGFAICRWFGKATVSDCQVITAEGSTMGGVLEMLVVGVRHRLG